MPTGRLLPVLRSRVARGHASTPLPWLVLVAAVTVLAWPLSAHDTRIDDGSARGGLRALNPAWPPLLFAMIDGRGTPSTPAGVPIYLPDPLPTALLQEFTSKGYKPDSRSGNFLAPKVLAKTLDQDLVAVQINGKYVRDLKGRPIFLRKSIRDKLLEADAAMFKKKQQHIVVNYGFRSNALQKELFNKISGHGKVAPPGSSFHETGMALDVNNWRDAQKFMIEAGFVGGCYGIEEDLVHYSIAEITKASNMDAFKRCTLKEIPENILKGLKVAGKFSLKPFKKNK